MKTLRFEMHDGVYEIPLELIAEKRADYYAIEVDGFKKGSKEYKEEVEFCMNDSYEAIDWITGSSDPSDWSVYIVKVKSVDSPDQWPDTEAFYCYDYEEE